LLQKKCEYHRTCCDYLVAAACQDGSAWNERKKTTTFLSAGCKISFEICEKVMHAHSGAWRCCDGKGRVTRVQCEILLAATSIVLCWTPNLHWYVLLGSSKNSTSRDHWNTALSQINGCYSLRCPSCLKGFALTGRLKTAKCECLWSSAHCQVRMFVSRANCQVRMFLKQPNRWLQ